MAVMSGGGRLAGKVAIITGAARGQGEAEARLFVAEGAKVVLADVLDDLGEVIAKSLNDTALGDAARYVHTDISSEDDWIATVAAAEELGPLNVLVNNAAILRVGAIADTSVADYRKVIDVNQIGTFLGMRSVIEPMKRAGGGSIVNISSIDGITAKPGLFAYGSTKAAVRLMTKTAAFELGPFGIRVNSVHPGGIYTPMAGEGFIPRPVIDGLHARIPVARAGDPIEVATMVLYLASDEASYCSGAEYVVDGGWLAGTPMPDMSGDR
jgi:3alpha(or 20beta)-hydroxysteroid dehydrogenase